MMENDFDKLRSAAFGVADAFRAGLLDHLHCREWADTWSKLLGELKRRCPGYPDEDYPRALNSGFYDSR
jgi:hypothetical protein